MIWPMEWIGKNFGQVAEAITVLTIILIVLSMLGIKMYDAIEEIVREWKKGKGWWNG